MCAFVGLSSTNLSSEYLCRSFNEQPIAIFDVPELSDTGKTMVEFYMDMHQLGQRGIYLENEFGKEWLHNPFLKDHLADDVAR